MAFNEVLARLSVVLGMDTAAFSTGSARAKKEVSTLERHIGRASGAIRAAVGAMFGAIAIDQIVDLTRRGLEYASSLGEVASQLGVTTKALQEYRYAASQAGIEQGEMDQALSQLTRRLGDAASGAKEPAKALEKLGVSVRDANGHVREAGDVIPLIADGLQKIQSPAERAAILVDLFGKSGQKLAPLLEGGAAGVNNLRNAAHELGIVLSDEQIQKADETADKLSAMKQVLEAKIAGAVADNTDSILALADALVKLVDAAGKAAKAWRYFSNLDFSWNAPSISKQFEAMAVRDLGPGVELTPGAAAAIRARRDARFLAPSGGSLLNAPKRAPATQPASPWGVPLNTNLNRRAVGGASFGGLDLSQFAPGSGVGGWMTAANDLVKPLTTADTLLQRMAMKTGVQMVANFHEAAVDGDRLASSAQSIIDRLFPDQARARQYANELATLKQRYGSAAQNAAMLAEAEARLRAEWIQSLPAINSIAKGFEKYGRASEDAADQARAANVKIVQSTADMAQDVLSSINQLSNSIRGGGFLDILSAIIGIGVTLGKAGVFGKSVQGVLNQPVGANANGTSYWRGGLSVVGERGPELVNLPRGASVTPNKDLRGMGGGIAEIVPSKYFDVVVDGRIVRASPAIMDGSAKVTTSRLGRRQKRQLYG